VAGAPRWIVAGDAPRNGLSQIVGSKTQSTKGERCQGAYTLPVVKAHHWAPPPGHRLHPFVYGIWQLRVSHPHWRQRVLPRGIVDVIFPLEGRLAVTEAQTSKTPIIHRTPFLVGLQTRAVVSEATGGLLVVGVSVKAETSRAILALPAHELSDLTVPADEIIAGAKGLFERLHDVPAFRDRCEILVDWLERSIRPPERLACIKHACSLIGRSADMAAIDRAARAMGYTNRHLRRLFREFVGTAPGEYLRLRRFNSALLQMRSSRNLTDIALAAGYYDQAHFCRDFKDLAGLTAGAYRAQAGAVPGILFADVRPIQSPKAPLA
jgi:AraC-like DNA-binding protein